MRKTITAIILALLAALPAQAQLGANVSNHKNVQIGGGSGDADGGVDITETGQILGATLDEITWSDSSFTHPVTLWLPANVYAAIKLDNAGDGTYLWGLSQSSAPGVTPLSVWGTFGATDPTDSIPAISLVGLKSDGATSTAALGAAETVLQVGNASTVLLDIKGNGDTELGTGLFYRETGGRLSLGHDEQTMNINGVAVDTQFSVHVEDGDGNEAEIESHRHSDTAGLGAVFYGARSRGSEGSETAVADGDVLTRLIATGHDGTDYNLSSAIYFEVDGTVVSNGVGGRIGFMTALDGTNSLVERLGVENDGAITVYSTVDGRDIAADGGDLDALAGAEANPALISQAEAEAGTATTERIFSALRVAQAIAALESGAYTHPNHSGDVISSGDGAQTIQPDSVDYAMLQNVVSDDRILGNVSGAGSIVDELTAAEVLTMINVEAAADVTDATNVAAALTLTGDITTSAGFATTIGANKVLDSMLVNDITVDSTKDVETTGEFIGTGTGDSSVGGDWRPGNVAFSDNGENVSDGVDESRNFTVTTGAITVDENDVFISILSEGGHGTNDTLDTISGGTYGQRIHVIGDTGLFNFITISNAGNISMAGSPSVTFTRGMTFIYQHVVTSTVADAWIPVGHM